MSHVPDELRWSPCGADHIYHADGSLRKRTILNYLLRRKGALTTTACDHGAFVRTDGEHVDRWQLLGLYSGRLVPPLLGMGPTDSTCI